MWLGQFSAKPSHSHFLAVKQVLCYLSGMHHLALFLGSPPSRVPLGLQGYMQNVGCSNADWASDAIDRRSISRYSFYFEGSLVSWLAVKQKLIALSSTEAKYYALTHAFKEALWLQAFLGFLKFPIPRPFPILSDNQAACSLLTLLQFQPVLNTSTFNTTLFATIFRPVLSLLFGCLWRTCLQIFLWKFYHFLFFLIIMMFSVFLFLLCCYESFCCFSFWWGCVDLYGHGVQNLKSHHRSHGYICSI